VKVTIYHNPSCSQSRKALALIRDAGIEPEVVDYLVTPPGRQVLSDLVERIGITVRDLLRTKEPVYADLGLQDAQLEDVQLIEAIAAHPIVTPHGARLCRPPELVLELLSKR
jgi:arsenate reductase